MDTKQSEFRTARRVHTRPREALSAEEDNSGRCPAWSVVKLRGHSASFAGGLTLLELLVVIAVIGILCALLAPALSSVRAAVKAAQCGNTVRQLTVALGMYTFDYSSYPLFAQLTATGWTFWPRPMAAYLGSKRVFVCPAVDKVAAQDFSNNVSYGYVDRGYAFQGVGEKIVVTGGRLESRPVHESEVSDPVNTLAFGDGIAGLKSGFLVHAGLSLERWRSYEPMPLSGSAALSLAELKVADKKVRELHRGRIQAGYCDGHVGSDKLGVLFTNLDSEPLSRWNRDHQPHKEWLDP
jgi:prepilin-type N-terminal cleavage/methylation domain-containing protein/prepilin-type processing-associated H-X9-DG protein